MIRALGIYCNLRIYALFADMWLGQMLQHICRLLSSKALRKTCTMYIVKKYMIQYFWSPLLLFFGCRIFFLCHRFLKIGFAQWVIHIFKIMQKIILYTVFAQIRGRWLIKILGFYGGGLLQFLPKNAPKSLKKGTFGPKKWWLIGISE